MVTILKSDVENRLIELAENGISTLGMRVVDVDCTLVGHRSVRIFIERVNSKGASINDCSHASEVISKLLEPVAELPSPYDLEVSSPGLDRRLRTENDFEGSLGDDIKLRLVSPIEGRANVTGRLVGCRRGVVEVAVDGTPLSVPISIIKKANIVWKEQKNAI